MGVIQLRRFASDASHALSDANRHVKNMVSKGLLEQTLRFYKEQLHRSGSGLYANNSIIPSVVKACSSADFLHFGLQLHCIALKSGSYSDSVTANSLLSFYAKCSHVESSRQLFDEMPIRDTVTWNSMITCYIRNGYCLEALETFKLMHLSGLESKPELIASILPICCHTGHWKSGREIHARVVRNGTIDTSIFLSTALVDMYSRCLNLNVALLVFNLMMEKNEVSWTTMIAGCTRNKYYTISLDYFRAMQMEEGLKPNRVTLIAVLPACSELGVLKHGKQIHGYSFRHGFDSESHLSAALVDMYCKCRGAMASANLMFERFEGKDVVMWSTMIRGYCWSGDLAHAMKLFNRMQLDGIRPNSVTLLAVVTSCTSLASMKHGQEIHGYIVKSGLGSEVNVGNTLMDMYAKSGCLQSSHQIFDEMPSRDLVSWSTLIQCYGLYGYGGEALQLFHEMRERQIELDAITSIVVMSACNHAGLVKEGKELFNCVIQDGKIAVTVEHYACYINLLVRSGELEEAYEAIIGMPMKPSPKIWSCLVSACRAHGRLDLAEKLLQQLIDLESDNAANYTLLCQVYAEIGDWRGAEEVRRVMRMRGLIKSCGHSRIESDHQVMPTCL